MTQITAHTVKPKGSWAGTPTDRVVLSYDDRFRRRILLTGVAGTKVLLSLKEAVHLQSGDALVAEDGTLIEVEAAAEKLIEVRCAARADLLRMAWHLGNRHLPTEITPKCLRIRYDKVILDMLHGLGAEALEVDAPFNPEGGAYGGHAKVEGHSHDHSHSHEHAHSHDHGHSHAH